jgi:hypothetical protein
MVTQQNCCLSSLTTAELADRCARETARFLRHADHDPAAGFELMRRALAEGSDEAFTQVYRVYTPLVTAWVYRHSRFALTGESADYFVSGAFRAFYLALRGERFARVPTLAAALGYLKTCVHTEIIQYLRGQKAELTVSADEVPEGAAEPDLGARVQAEELWAHLCRLLPDERDRQLARCAFALGLKPRQVCAAYPAQWRSEREVSVALYRLRRILRADPDLAARASHPATDRRIERAG